MSSKLKPGLLLAVIFVVGILTGSALTIGFGPHFNHPPDPPGPPGPPDMQRHWMAHLTHKLNLTADQQAKIQPILANAEAKIQALHRDEMERGSQIFKAADDQISAFLTSDQKAELQRMESEREKMFSGHMGHWGPPRDEPREPAPPEAGQPAPPNPPPPNS